jgi:hypothetical protein
MAMRPVAPLATRRAPRWLPRRLEPLSAGRKLRPIGENLIDGGFADVQYVDPKIEAIDDRSALLTSKWAMNKAHGVITRELWVLQADATALLREDHFEALKSSALIFSSALCSQAAPSLMCCPLVPTR